MPEAVARRQRMIFGLSPASCFLPPVSASAPAAAAHRALLEGRVALLRTVAVAAAIVLADDDDVAFFQIAADLGDAAIREARAHKARLDLFIVADHNPDHLSLSPLAVAATAGLISLIAFAAAF